MRSTKFTEIKVGAFVVIILVLFAVVIFAIGSHQRYFQSQYTLWACFSNIKGLVVGAPVRLAGLTVGRVSAIYFAGDIEEKTIKVEMKINKGIQERIREDSIATIQTMGLLGDKYVEITLGSPENKVLSGRARIKSVDPIDLFAYVAKTEAVIDVINTILVDIKEISTQVRSGKGFLHAVLYDPAGGKLVRNLSVASASLDDLIKELSDTSRSLSTIVSKEGGDLVKDLSMASSSLDDLMKELSSVAQSLNNIVKKVERGEGSLGAIINDPSVYEDLKVILGGAKRSQVIKGLIRYTIKKKKEEGIGEAGR
ncbi:MAG: MCE family protein [Deltaproteobacteria bacterium]|nr:MCE family protein [Deltaproteobacteria bacterium]